MQIDIRTKQGSLISEFITKEIADVIIREYNLERALIIRTVTNDIVIIKPNNIQCLKIYHYD